MKKRKRNKGGAAGLLSWADGNAFGSMLVSFRRRAGVSQLHLALDAEVSTRHLGFLEIGRAEPSRSMVQRLASALCLGPFDRDQLHIAAGYLPSRHRKGQDVFRRTVMALASMEAANAIYTDGDQAALGAIVSSFLKRFGMSQSPCLTRYIGDAERTLQALLQRQLQQAGLSFAEWVAMILLSGAESRAIESFTDAIIASRIVAPGLERDFINALAQSGLVTGEAQIALTEKGYGLFRPLRSRVQEITASLMSDLREADIETTRQVLEAISRRAGQRLAEAA